MPAKPGPLSMTADEKSRIDQLTATLCALCFFLSAVEFAIPKPLPFLRIGLANLPVMLAVDILPVPAFCALVFIKILGQGLIGGTLFSYIFLFSAAGTAASALVMFGLKKTAPRAVSCIGVSVAGAFASNAAQLTLARWYIFGPSAWYIAPPFLAVGVVTGAVLGAFANRFAGKSRWYADAASGTAMAPVMEEISAPARTPRQKILIRLRFLAGTAALLALMFSDNTVMQVAIVAISAIVLARETRIRPLPVLLMSGAIIVSNLFLPFGKVLWEPFGLPVTQGALLLGIKKALTVEGMIFISRWMLKPGIRLPGKTGALVSRAFAIFGYLTGSKSRIDPRNLIASIDDIMYGRG